MVKDSYIYILNNPSFIEKQDAGEIKAVIDKYPYFQSARALFLKALKEQESFKYNNELKLTAAFTTDRSILFNFITSELFKENEKSEGKKEIKSEDSSVNEIEKVKSDLGIGEPIAFTKNETHSFNQWLQLSSGTIKKIIWSLKIKNP